MWFLLLLVGATTATEETCHYGYIDGKDAYGEPCEDCVGPKEWGSCWEDCDGQYQSPIDIDTSKTLKGFERLNPEYDAVKGLTLFNTGHNLQVNGEFGSITVAGVTYEAIQFHFHILSEHTVNGNHSDAEMHIVHSATDGSGLLVIGILFELIQEDVDNPFLTSIKFEQGPLRETDAEITLDVVDLRDLNDIFRGDYYRYKGSLTTPPCSEVVEWFVMANPAPLSPSEYQYFQAIFPNPSNFRPIQPLNGRNILQSRTALGALDACVLGADVCGAGLECVNGLCLTPMTSTSSSTKKSDSTGFSLAVALAFFAGILLTLLIVLSATLYLRVRAATFDGPYHSGRNIELSAMRKPEQDDKPVVVVTSGLSRGDMV